MPAEQTAEVAHPYVERRPGVHGRRPVIRGSRFPVSPILLEERRGMTMDDILREFP